MDPAPAPPTDTGRSRPTHPTDTDDADADRTSPGPPYTCDWCGETFGDAYANPLQTYANHCKNCEERPDDGPTAPSEEPPSMRDVAACMADVVRRFTPSRSGSESTDSDDNGPFSHKQRMRLLATAEATHPDDLPDEVYRGDFAAAAVAAGFLLGAFAAHDAAIEMAMVNVMMVIFGIERAGRYVSRIPERWLSYLRDNIYEAAAGAAMGIGSIRFYHFHVENPEASPIPTMLDATTAALPILL